MLEKFNNESRNGKIRQDELRQRKESERESWLEEEKED